MSDTPAALSAVSHEPGPCGDEIRENHAFCCDQAFKRPDPEDPTGPWQGKTGGRLQKGDIQPPEQSSWIPLARPKLFNVRRSDIEGYTFGPLTNDNFADTPVKQ